MLCIRKILLVVLKKVLDILNFDSFSQLISLFLLLALLYLKDSHLMISEHSLPWIPGHHWLLVVKSWIYWILILLAYLWRRALLLALLLLSKSLCDHFWAIIAFYKKNIPGCFQKNLVYIEFWFFHMIKFCLFLLLILQFLRFLDLYTNDIVGSF